MVDEKSIVNDFTDDDLALASIHSSSSSKSEGDALEGNNSLENYSNSGATNNDHTNDAIEDEMMTMICCCWSCSYPCGCCVCII